MKILVTDLYSTEALARLRGELKCEITTSVHAPTAQDLLSANILLIRSRTKIDEKLLKLAPELKLIVSATAGFDHIDLKATEKFGVKVCHTPAANTESAAQLTLTFLLNSQRQFITANTATRDGHWKNKLKPARELNCQTLALLGFGRVGQRVAELAQPFNLDIIAYDPYVNDEAFSRLHVDRVGITELLVQADFLSLHVPLTSETYHMLRTSTLEAMAEHAWIINTSRGAVISESELIMALEQGTIAGAALDVFEVEPLPKDSRLRALPNVILSPHIGAFTEDAFIKGSEAAIQKVAEFLRAKQVSDMLPPDTEWAKYLR